MHTTELPPMARLSGDSPAAVGGNPVAQLYGADGIGGLDAWFDWSEPSLAA